MSENIISFIFVERVLIDTRDREKSAYTDRLKIQEVLSERKNIIFDLLKASKIKRAVTNISNLA